MWTFILAWDLPSKGRGILMISPAVGTLSEHSHQAVRSYFERVGLLLTENPYAFWRRGFWTYGHWTRRDSELQKTLTRICSLLDEVLRRGADGALGASDQSRLQGLLELAPGSLTLDVALEFAAVLDQVIIESGDAQYICAEIDRELLWAKDSTTWLTWDRMYGTTIPDAVKTHNLGKSVPDVELRAARNRLLAFRRARTNDYEVHRARMKMRAKNLRVLAALLGPLILGFGWLLAAHQIGSDSASGVGLVAVVGALGSIMSGTIRARDKLVRGSDLRAFRNGLLAQILLGAGASLFLLLLLGSSILAIAGTNSLAGKAVFGFVAGFSEPFFLKTVERVAKLGEETTKGT